jgi:hypothetical protein
MRSVNFPTLDYARQCFREDNGRLYWKERPLSHFASEGMWRRFHKRFAGKESGTSYSDEYGYTRYRVCITCNGRQFSINRSIVVWSLHNNRWPIHGEIIDHKDLDSSNDIISNLRLCNQSQNTANSRKNSRNTSGYKGVQWCEKKKRWRVRINDNGIKKSLGSYADPKEAHLVYIEAAKRVFGEFYHDGE